MTEALDALFSLGWSALWTLLGLAAVLTLLILAAWAMLAWPVVALRKDSRGPSWARSPRQAARLARRRARRSGGR